MSHRCHYLLFDLFLFFFPLHVPNLFHHCSPIQFHSSDQWRVYLRCLLWCSCKLVESLSDCLHTIITDDSADGVALLVESFLYHLEDGLSLHILWGSRIHCGSWGIREVSSVHLYALLCHRFCNTWRDIYDSVFFFNSTLPYFRCGWNIMIIKNDLKISWIIGRLVVYWVGVIMRFIFIKLIFT